jgi:hypothetical protein
VARILRDTYRVGIRGTALDGAILEALRGGATREFIANVLGKSGKAIVDRVTRSSASRRLAPRKRPLVDRRLDDAGGRIRRASDSAGQPAPERKWIEQGGESGTDYWTNIPGKTALQKLVEHERDYGSLFADEQARTTALHWIASLDERLLQQLNARITDSIPGGLDGAYRFGERLMKIARTAANAKDPLWVPKVLVHEFAHHLQFFIDKQSYRSLRQQYLSELRAHMVRQRLRKLDKPDYHFSSLEEWWARRVTNMVEAETLLPSYLRSLPVAERLSQGSLLALARFFESVYRFFLRNGRRDAAHAVYETITNYQWGTNFDPKAKGVTTMRRQAAERVLRNGTTQHK